MSRQSGISLLSILLFSIALFAASVFVVFGSGTNAVTRIEQYKTAVLLAQSQLIATRVSKCAADYPAGDNQTGFHVSYPAGSHVAVATLVCPGSLQNLWRGVDGVYLPRAPEGFNDWRYSNDSNSVRIEILAKHATDYARLIAAAAAKIGPSADTFTSDTLTVKIVE